MISLHTFLDQGQAAQKAADSVIGKFKEEKRQEKMSAPDVKWLIWSNEHNGWWKQHGNGYTKSRAEAGRFTFWDAMQSCEAANANLNPGNAPEETMCPDWRIA